MDSREAFDFWNAGKWKFECAWLDGDVLRLGTVKEAPFGAYLDFPFITANDEVIGVLHGHKTHLTE